MQNQVILSTDGSCIKNPGPGGWACVLRFDSRVGEMYGCAPETTNQQMELQAVIEGLKALKKPCVVTVSTDSQYVKRGYEEYLPRWKANGWKKSKNTKGSREVSNQELWKELDKQVSKHKKVEWQKVKAHADDADNRRCDSLAIKAAREQISSKGVVRL